MNEGLQLEYEDKVWKGERMQQHNADWKWLNQMSKLKLKKKRIEDSYRKDFISFFPFLTLITLKWRV